MSDIVKQLRSIASRGRMNDGDVQVVFDAADEIANTRAAIWEAYRILGFDTDGDTAYRGTKPIGEFLIEFATEQRKDYDDAMLGLSQQELSVIYDALSAVDMMMERSTDPLPDQVEEKHPIVKSAMDAVRKLL